MEIERRTLVGVELRAKEGEPTTIVGYAAVFNEMSEEIFGFREVILPGAFDRALKEKQDVRALVNHDENMIIGRTKSGTLSLKADKKGLKAEIELPDTQAGRDVRTSIQRGDLDGMSFAFFTVTDQWRTVDGEQVRELVDLDLQDVSVVAFPAYPATSVSTRALEHVKKAADAHRQCATCGAHYYDPENRGCGFCAHGVPNEVNEARLRHSAR